MRNNNQHPPTSPNIAPATQNNHPTSDRNLLKTVKRHCQCVTDPNIIQDRSEHNPENANRRATEATFRTRQKQMLLKITMIPPPTIIPNFTTCCACHEKWHINFTKYYTCHKKWHINFIKCCTYHKKLNINVPKCCTYHEKSHEITHNYYYYYYY